MNSIAICVLACLGVCSHASGQSGIITTYAGSRWVFPAKVTMALSAPLGYVSGVAVDSSGNIYIADPSNNRIFRVSSAGAIQIVAGNGIQGFSGDGGPATAASLNIPGYAVGSIGEEVFGVAVDSSGNLFFADYGNNRIRKVSSDGIITTVAGGGTGGDGGLATAASLNQPQGIAVDGAGNLFIADGLDSRVRKVSPSGIITTVAGTGAYGFSGDGGLATAASLYYPDGVAVDASGNLFIADLNNNRVRKVSASGIITTVAGTGGYGFSGDGGQAIFAWFDLPAGVAVDASGNLFVADYGNQRIRKISSSGIITTFAGNGIEGPFDEGAFSGDGGLATSASLYSPNAVAVDASGSLFVADSFNQRIRKVPVSGIITTVAGNGSFGFSGDGGPAISASLNLTSGNSGYGYVSGGIEGVAVDGSGNVFIADSFNNRIRKVSPGGIITTVAGNSAAGFSGDGGPATSATLNQPQGIAVDGSGNLFFADYANRRVRRISASGVITTVAGGGTSGFGEGGLATAAQLGGPTGVAVDGAGDLFIVDTFYTRIRKVSVSGIITTVAGGNGYGFSGDGGPATMATFYNPTGIALDASGDLFIADTYNERIRRVSASGIVTTVAGNGTAGFSGDGGPATSAELSGPSGLALDALGNLFIVDSSNNRIRELTTGGIIVTVAGNGTRGLSGDGGLAISAEFYSPNGVAVDASEDLFIVDYDNDRIREVAASALDAFFTGQVAVSPVWNYLQFPDGKLFGYYTYLQVSTSTSTAYIYHADLGYEYVQPGNLAGSMYMFDFASGHWWYTSASLFPDLYDFTLNAWIYYFPNTSSPGHYTANPRYFSNLSTGQILAM